MKNLKVSMKLMVSFLIMIVLSVIVGIVGIIGVRQLNGSVSSMYDTNLIPIKAIGNIRELFSSQREDMRILFLTKDSDQTAFKTSRQNITDADNTIQQYLAAYESGITDTAGEASYYEAKQHWQGSYADMKKSILAKVDAGDFDSAYAILTDPANQTMMNKIESDFSASADFNDNEASTNDIQADSLYTTLLTILIAVMIVAVAVALFLVFYISGLISKPLVFLSGFMKRAGGAGDITLREEDNGMINKYSSITDEIGQTISSSAMFIRHVTNIANELKSVANGDLTCEIKLLSENDVMGLSLKRTIDNLNSMFAEINSSTTQVSTGSKQVADGAQSLAQGSTEQAASIQELSSSITEISEKTKENAKTAEKTARLSATIKENAEKGSQQMDEMIGAVKEINDASQSISKIIKTIDDIAFQTNILALNAAVEAARAGQHGKGFAVVAEEVRNLASKSAEAAKDTGSMIQNSMEKAELGTRIAGETAVSLREIVTGISESSNLVAEIAKSSEEQSQGISQINIGIDQVAQVVQQNSATAEESAAASEEMSGQSDMLMQLITQFKLKENDNTFKSLPSPERQRSQRNNNETRYSSNKSSGDFGKY